MKIVGYGICGPGEASRYMRATMEEFKRLCDETIILCNNAGPAEKALVYEYGFKMVQDTREWGVLQWKIKQDFIEQHVAKKVEVGDMMVCLDMDEVLSPECDREWLLNAPLDAYHVFVVDLWNDPEHYKPESCFWNVRLWRWNGETKWKEKPVHCGLAPEWAYYYHRFAPFLLKHYGLMDRDVRMKKVARYEQYDPNAKHLDKRYYDMLKSEKAVPFVEADLYAKVKAEVATYQQTKPRQKMEKPKTRFAYIKNQAGNVLDIPEKDLKETLMRPGFSFIGWAEDNSKALSDLFEGEEISETDGPVIEKKEGSYQKDVRGFGPGKEWDPEKVDDAALEAMAKQAEPAAKAPAPKTTPKKAAKK